jgi:hypothetical protein
MFSSLSSHSQPLTTPLLSPWTNSNNPTTSTINPPHHLSSTTSSSSSTTTTIPNTTTTTTTTTTNNNNNNNPTTINSINSTNNNHRPYTNNTNYTTTSSSSTNNTTPLQHLHTTITTNQESTFQFMSKRKLERQLGGTYKENKPWTIMWTFLTLLLMFGLIAPHVAQNKEGEGGKKSIEIQVDVRDLGFISFMALVSTVFLVYTLTKVVVVVRWSLYWLLATLAILYLWKRQYNLFSRDAPLLLVVSFGILEFLTFTTYITMNFIYPRTLSTEWFREYVGITWWWDLKSMPGHQPWTFTYRSSNPLEGRRTCTYRGETDGQQKPHGFGHWLDDAFHGELLSGLWEHGIPVGPFRSREFGSGFAFENVRVGFVHCSDDSYSGRKWFPSQTGLPKIGVASVECSVAGGFFSHLPKAQILQGPFVLHPPINGIPGMKNPYEESLILNSLNDQRTVTQILPHIKQLYTEHPSSSLTITATRGRGVVVSGHTFVGDENDRNRLVIDVIPSSSSTFSTTYHVQQLFHHQQPTIAAHVQGSNNASTLSIDSIINNNNNSNNNGYLRMEPPIEMIINGNGTTTMIDQQQLQNQQYNNDLTNQSGTDAMGASLLLADDENDEQESTTGMSSASSSSSLLTRQASTASRNNNHVLRGNHTNNNTSSTTSNEISFIQIDSSALITNNNKSSKPTMFNSNNTNRENLYFDLTSVAGPSTALNHPLTSSNSTTTPSTPPQDDDEILPSIITSTTSLSDDGGQIHEQQQQPPLTTVNSSTNNNSTTTTTTTYHQPIHNIILHGTSTPPLQAPVPVPVPLPPASPFGNIEHTKSAPFLRLQNWKSTIDGHVEALVFFPGFNASLEHSLERIGQFLCMGRFPPHIKPFVFSWPCARELTYIWAVEAARSERTHAALAWFLRDLQAAGIRDVHFLVHSLGAQAVLSALRDDPVTFERSPVSKLFARASEPDFLSSSNSSSSTNNTSIGGYLRLRTCTLLNPDTPLSSFLHHDFSGLRRVCAHITVVGDRKDGALDFSEMGNGLVKTYHALKEYFKSPAKTKRQCCSRCDDRDTFCCRPCAACFRICVDGSCLPYRHGEDRLFSRILTVGRNIFSLYAAHHGVTRGEIPEPISNNPNMRFGTTPVTSSSSNVRRKWLDLDAIDTSSMDTNVHQLRHAYFDLNKILVEDLVELIVTGKRASERSLLLHREGNIFSFCQAPACVVNP